jgi:hypothetical protein
VNQEAALAKLSDAVALWSVRQATAADVVYAACDLLVAGAGGLALGELAAVSVRNADEEIPVLLEAALLEAGLAYHERDTLHAQEDGLRVMCARVVAGVLAPRDLTTWAYATCGHDKLALAENLAMLDHVYDTIDCRDVRLEDVDAEVVAQARLISAGSAPRPIQF